MTCSKMASSFTTGITTTTITFVADEVAVVVADEADAVVVATLNVSVNNVGHTG